MVSNVIVRCDGSLKIGSGHIFRTLVLANELRYHGFKVTYICRDYEEAQYNRIKKDGFRLFLLNSKISESEDTKLTIDSARKQRTKWLIIDRYAAREADFLKFKESGLLVMAIDDICNQPFPVDILLNQNINAKKLHYKTLAETVPLLGTEYALIRNVYLKYRPLNLKSINKITNVMIFMGGADHVNATAKVFAAVNRIKSPLNIKIVVGRSYQFESQLENEIKKSSHRVQIFKDLPDLSILMKIADIGISACGSVIWEFCCMGVPTLLLPIAHNQEEVSLKMDEMGCAFHLGRAETISFEKLREKIENLINNKRTLMDAAKNAWKLVDGLGAKRIVEKIKSY